MYQKDISTRKKIIIISSVLVIILMAVVYAYIKSTENKFGDYIKIQNYNKYILDLPKEKKDLLNSSLYSLAKMNTYNGDLIKVNDALIRDGSVNKGYDKERNVHYGSFIVDMKSIKQSYRLSYEWSSDVKNAEFMLTGPPSSCLSPDELKYGDFSCKDAITEMEKNIDPIIEHLPYSTFHHYITANAGKDGKTGLDVTIYLISREMLEENRQLAIDKYKAETVEWIKSINLDPENYIIDYKIN